MPYGIDLPIPHEMDHKEDNSMTTKEETTPTVKQKMIQTGPRNTVRSRSRAGKPTRQLQSACTDAWDASSALGPMPMPIQGVSSLPVMEKIDRLRAERHEGAYELLIYYVG